MPLPGDIEARLSTSASRRKGGSELVDLPVLDAVPALIEALREKGSAVLVAPPGAGKTTAIAPALLDQPWCSGQILLTSPRRVAARAAAERMAEMLGESIGETVGYLTRLDSRSSAKTRILVMTEAIVVNRLIEDPELKGVSALLFDEAHERHLDSDLGLAFAVESRAILREDLRLVAMSATIDGARFASLLGDAPVIESKGRAHPLHIRWLGSSPTIPLEESVANAIQIAWRDETGDILAFLPGIREIERTFDRLAGQIPDAAILPLHGQIDPEGQRAAIRRDNTGRRRIVLATAIAESSLTLDGVNVVVDSGLARFSEYDRAAGTTHLVTRRASQASAAQRAGRAARQGPGTAYRLWEEASHAGRPRFDSPEIENADLAPMVLRVSLWGTTDAATLPLLDPPPMAALQAARKELQTLGAVDAEGRITAFGRKLASLPLEPSAAAMVLFGAQHGAAEEAARLALLLQERGLGGRGEDLVARRARWKTDRTARARASAHLAKSWALRADELLDRLDREKPPDGVLLAAGRPGFIARRRDANGEKWLSSGGRGFVLDPGSPLAREEFLVIADAQGQARGARITAAAALSEIDLERWLSHHIETRRRLHWNGSRIEPRLERRLGAITLASGPDPEPDSAAITDLLMQKAGEKLDDILPADLLARARYAGVEALQPKALKTTMAQWLAPLLEGRRDLDIAGHRIKDMLLGLLSWDEREKLETRAPSHFISPASTTHAIDYIDTDAPSIEVRVQALFGLDHHPMIGDTPLLLKLTSPANRPIQATRDLPGFWRGSWADVRKEMKGRYPKHRWPDEPWTESPSLKTKNAFEKKQ